MPRYTYWHGYIENPGGKTSYDWKFISNWLKEMGNDGWELVNMTPDWAWGTVSGLPSRELLSDDTTKGPYSVPLYLAQWFCTFKKIIGE